jgi:hypothetical protein
MTLTEQKVILQDQIASVVSILDSKGHDYTNQKDMLEVFKKVGGVLDISPLQVCSVFATTKIVRISSLLANDKTPNYESIRDSFRDLQAYSLLMEQCYLDSQPAPSFKTSNDWD